MIRCPVCQQLIELDTDGIHGRLVARDPSGRLHPHPEATAPVPLDPEPSLEVVPRRRVRYLDEEEVMEILESDERHEDLANRFGLSVSSIYAIWKGERNHVDGYDYQALAIRRAALTNELRRRRALANWKNQHREAA
jgi:hypothetical protein